MLIWKRTVILNLILPKISPKTQISKIFHIFAVLNNNLTTSTALLRLFLSQSPEPSPYLINTSIFERNNSNIKCLHLRVMKSVYFLGADLSASRIEALPFHLPNFFRSPNYSKQSLGWVRLKVVPNSDPNSDPEPNPNPMMM